MSGGGGEGGEVPTAAAVVAPEPRAWPAASGRPRRPPQLFPGADRVAVIVFKESERTGEPVSMGLVKRVVNDLLTHPEECHCGDCQAAVMAIWWAMLTAASAGLSEHAATSMAMLLLTVNAR